MAMRISYLHTIAFARMLQSGRAFAAKRLRPRSGGCCPTRTTILKASVSTSTTSSEGNPTFDYAVTVPESEYSQVLVSQLEIAKELRGHWDAHFKDPREPDAARFVWDPWFVKVGDGKFGTEAAFETDITPVEGEIDAAKDQIQYSLKRTQTSNFFPEDMYLSMIDDLVDLASSVGLTAVTPPWISLYTDGDMQNFHTDAPHGPLAFVFSLCKEGDFSGGETIMLQPKMMEYWRGFDSSRGLESGNIMRFIPPTPLGRFLAFDPRVPHGVNRVVGSQDPREGRIVIHGWFNEPEVCWFGPWNADGNQNKVVEGAINPLIEALGSGEIGRVVGYLAVRVEVNSDGLVDDVKAVCDTVQADLDDFRGIIGYDEEDRPVMEEAASDVRLTAFEALKGLIFEEGEDSRSVVIPFLFE